MQTGLVELYEKYIGCFCQVAVDDWNDKSKLFWRSGTVKRVDNIRGLYLEELEGDLVAIPLSEIVKIKEMSRDD